MGDYLVDYRDVKFNLYEYLKIDQLCAFEKFSEFNKETFDMVLDQALKFSKEILGPMNAPADKEGVKFDKGKVTFPDSFKDAYRRYCEGGWIGLTISPEWGGQGMPSVMGAATGEFFTGACCAFIMTPGLTHGAAHLFETWASDELKGVYLEKMYSGQWAGTMCLTEAQAGTAVGDTKTTAIPVGDGTYKIQGTKIFITSGEHDLTENIIHAVLARTPTAPPGIKGISLFLVPKVRVNPDGSLGERNDVACGSVEHKMGIHASATCVLNFGENNNCIGYLVGRENEGIKAMFQMMNEARIGVGMQGMAQAGAAYLNALKYANERVQGVDIAAMKDPNAPRVLIIQHPDVRRMLMFGKSMTEAMRALLLKTAFCTDMARATSDPQEKEKYNGFVELLTPICKAYCSDKGFDVAVQALQVHGGYGFCSEYPAEQYVRDVKISSIYEGTNGVQALDLLGRKIGMKGGMLFMNLIMELNSFIEAHKAHPICAKYVSELERAKETLAQTTMLFQEKNMSGDIYYPVLYATPFLEMFGEVVCAWVLMEQAVIACDKLDHIFKEKGATTGEARKKVVQESSEAKYYDGKVQSARFYACQILPGVHSIAESIKSDDRSPLEVTF